MNEWLRIQNDSSFMKPTINETWETKQIKNKQQQKLKSGGNKETNKNH